jgi:hypothetical protein
MDERVHRPYCLIELPTAAKVLVAFDPMSRTVAATSTRMTAIITAYSAISCPSCCDHNLCIIKHEFPLFLRLLQWLVRGVTEVLAVVVTPGWAPLD